jgi:hypothetical protein
MGTAGGVFAQAALRGVVRGESGRPIAGARIVLQPLGLAGVSSDSGAFHIAPIPPGSYTVVVRALGYQDVMADAFFEGRDTLTVGFDLQRGPRQLDPITVETEASPRVAPSLVGFEERRKAGFGRFLTRPDLANLPLACYVAVYLDGVRLWAPGQTNPPNLDTFSIVSLEAVDVYRGPSEAPIQFQTTGSACGALLLWTRTGDG